MSEDSQATRDDTQEELTAELEQALAAERERSAKLAHAVKDLRHKAEILEKSYAKQLEDARQRCQAAEDERDELASRVVELEKELTSPRPAHAPGWQAEKGGVDLGFEAPEGTINALLDDSFWLERKAAGDIPGQPVDDIPEPEAEQPDGDMLDPGLVFSRKSGTE